jgi:hypothetical protein
VPAALGPCVVAVTDVLSAPATGVRLQSVVPFRDGPDAGPVVARSQRSPTATSAEESRAADVPISGGNSAPVPGPMPEPGSQPTLPPPTSPAPTGSLTCAGARASNGQENRGDGVDLPVMTLVASQDVDVAGRPARPATGFTGRVVGGAEDPAVAPD